MDQLTIDSRRAHASADTDKEENISLTPAHKTRIFRNGINERNQAGWYFWDREHYTSQIEMGAVGLKRIEKLFTLNPELTPAMLLQVVDKGTEEFKSRPMPRASEKELFDRFSSIKCVAYFACALSRLVVFYGLAAEFEGVTYLGEESEQEEVDTEHSVAA